MLVCSCLTQIGANMSFLDLATSRYSCRAFTDEPVTQSELDQLLEAVRVAVGPAVV